jgi:hypothetical protein
MMQVYDLRGDAGAGTSSRCSAALRILYSLKSMTLIRIRACTRDHSWTKKTDQGMVAYME